MTRPDDSERAKDIVGLWQSAVVPLDDETAEAARRALVVPAVGRAILRAAKDHERERNVRRIALALSMAASVAVAIGFGRHYARHAGNEGSRGVPSGVRAVEGEVTLVHRGASSVVDRAQIEMGDSLETAADAKAEMRLTDLVVAEIEGSSELSLLAPKAAIHRVRLDRGSILAHVDDRPSSTPKLVVETPNVEVVVTGTVLEVDVSQVSPTTDPVTVVAVTKGRVVVRHGGMELAQVTAGQRWTSAPVTARLDAPPTAGGSDGTTSRADRMPTAKNAMASRSGTLAEENALFQDAIDARNRGNYRDAISGFGALLDKYPGSLLGGEARVERMRALERMAQKGAAAREARRYLADYPDGFAREEARKLVMEDDSSAGPPAPSNAVSFP